MKKVFLLAMLALASAGFAAESGEVLEADTWYVGYLNKQPLMTMHLVVKLQPDGGRISHSDTMLAIERKLGAASLRMEMRQTAIFREDENGHLVSFAFDEEQDGQRTSAIGRVENRQVIATVHRLGRMQEQKFAIPEGVDLLSDEASRDLALNSDLKPGDSVTHGGLQLFSGSVIVVRCTTVFKKYQADGNLLFETTMDIIPVPTLVEFTPAGELASMSLNFGFISIDLKPSDGPVPLLGAQVAPMGLVTAAGPAPKADAENRYRVPTEAAVALGDDPFQQIDNGELRVLSEAAPEALADRTVYLRPEAQLELDDPELRAWVATVVGDGKMSEAELAEQMRLAVRNYLKGDLTKGDASALEAFRDKRGDCTEHANLLCAALRIAGIPARTEAGLVYSAQYGGWGGHAWNSAYIVDRWVHLDSAYPGIARSQYIKLGGMSLESGIADALMANLTKLAGKSIETIQP
jgi:hypothetical protein